LNVNVSKGAMPDGTASLLGFDTSAALAERQPPDVEWREGKSHAMKKSSNADKKSLRSPSAPAHTAQAWCPSRRDPSGVEPRSRGFRFAHQLAPFVAWLGVLTTSSLAAAQAAPAPNAPAAPAPAPAPNAPAAPAPAPAAAAPAPAPAAAAPAATPEAPAAASPAPAAAPEASGAPEVGADAAVATPDGNAEPVPEDPAEGELAEVVVTGFRVSLGAALQKKQRATGQVDAIVAEDIADFPDLNLAESLQRIPGVAITRTNGEGNQITVRGLPSLYTRVRVNGMEARGNVGNGTSNGGRGFDFNLFASELFNSIVVHKTASADLDEGSLGSVVDLNTARAFNFKEGWTFVTAATGVYNDLSDTVRPRLTGLVAYRDPSGIWGATASAAYQRVRLDQVATDTVNWQKARFRSVDGAACADDMGVATMDPGCLDVADAFHPRIPRFLEDTFRGDRLGLTSGVQFRPAENTELRLDALYATYPSRVDQRRLFPLVRNNEGTTDLSNYTLVSNPDRFGAGNDSLIAGNLDNAWVRSEHQRVDQTARFFQIGLGLDHRFSDVLFLNAFAGRSRSSSGRPHDTTVNYDNRAYNGYRFDFTNDKAPILAFNGANVADPATFVVPELRDIVQDVDGGFDVAEANLHVDIFDELKLAAGVNYKRATYETKEWNRNGTVCGLNLYDCDQDDDGVNDPGFLGPPGDPALSQVVNFRGDAGPGSTTRWVSPVIDGWANRLGYYDAPLIVTEGGTNRVTENNLGTYLQARGEFALPVGDMRLLYDAGVRYVQTRQSSRGYQQGTPTTVERPMYDDWLPSANAALWLTDQVVLRLGAARVMVRPALGDLSPGAGVDSAGFTISFQNPNLDPTRATTLDAAAEWYFANGSLLSVAVFTKDIDSFPIRETQRGTFASTGLPASVIFPTSPAAESPGFEGVCGDPAGCWSISQLSNGPGSTVKGIEFGFQAPFRAFTESLPPVLRDMGVLANYTYVDSTADYTFLGNPVKERLTNLSNGQYNATLYYDDERFSARASLAYRSDYLTEGPFSQGNLWAYTESSTRLDGSTSYAVNKYLKISLEGLNLLDTPGSARVDVDAQRRAFYGKTGRTLMLGARFTY
jgi:iron complex outermembrane receptor protein